MTGNSAIRKQRDKTMTETQHYDLVSHIKCIDCGGVVDVETLIRCITAKRCARCIIKNIDAEVREARDDQVNG